MKYAKRFDRCLICRRELSDDRSRILGLGTHCQKEYGTPTTPLPEDAAIVAVEHVRALSDIDARWARKIEAFNWLSRHGFTKMCKLLSTRFLRRSQVEVYVYKDCVDVRSYTYLGDSPGRYHGTDTLGRHGHQFKNKAEAWTAIRHHVSGSIGKGPKGFFAI